MARLERRAPCDTWPIVRWGAFYHPVLFGVHPYVGCLARVQPGAGVPLRSSSHRPRRTRMKLNPRRARSNRRPVSLAGRRVEKSPVEARRAGASRLPARRQSPLLSAPHPAQPEHRVIRQSPVSRPPSFRVESPHPLDALVARLPCRARQPSPRRTSGARRHPSPTSIARGSHPRRAPPLRPHAGRRQLLESASGSPPAPPAHPPRLSHARLNPAACLRPPPRRIIVLRRRPPLQLEMRPSRPRSRYAVYFAFSAARASETETHPRRGRSPRVAEACAPPEHDLRRRPGAPPLSPPSGVYFARPRRHRRRRSWRGRQAQAP